MKQEILWFSDNTKKCYSLTGVPKWVLKELLYLLKRIEALETELKGLKNA